MNNLASRIQILVLSIFLTACSGSGPAPAAQTFLNAWRNGDIEVAMGSISSEADDLERNKIQGMLLWSLNEGRLTGVEFEVTDVEAEGDVATVTFVVLEKGETVQTETLNMVKEKGTWKVSVESFSK